jgi:hypothetical protein
MDGLIRLDHVVAHAHVHALLTGKRDIDAHAASGFISASMRCTVRATRDPLGGDPEERGRLERRDHGLSGWARSHGYRVDSTLADLEDLAPDTDALSPVEFAFAYAG